MSDCGNDCRDPVAFPRAIVNRPGLERISYRIGTYEEIREAMLHWIDTDPNLQRWTHRKSDDAGIALIEGAAILGDILTFYQDRYANEKYLRTAEWRDSVADLVRLLGYRLSPGIGGRGTFAFEIRGDKPVTVPKGFRLSAEVTGRDGQSDFEVVEPVIAVPALSRFSLHRPAAFPNIAAGVARLSMDTAALAAAGVTLEKNDRLMIASSAGAPANQRQVVVVDAVRQQFERTEVTIKGAWQGQTVTNAVGYKLGRSFRFFGYNAPEKKTVISGGSATQEDVTFWHQTGMPDGWTLAYMAGFHYALPSLASFPLDQQVDDLSVGGLMLVMLDLGVSGDRPVGTQVMFERRILGTHAETLTRGALTGGTTVVDFDSNLALNYIMGAQPLIYTDIRTVQMQEVLGPRFAVNAARVPTSSTDLTRVSIYSDAATYAAANGRRIQLTRGSTVEETVLSIDPAASSTGTQLRPVTLSPALRAFSLSDFPLDGPTVVAYGNLVDATQGQTEREAVLGNGDSRQSFQTFKLPKVPLTYLNRAGSTPPETPELEILVADRRWTLVPSLFGHGPTDQIFIVREDANGDSWVQFGDDVSGARLPSGLGNVRARFRTGIEAYGPLKEDTNVQAGRLDRLEKIRLFGVATGGNAPETADSAREAAPGKIQSLGRLVSIRDFETEAIAIPGVWRVKARWSLVSNVPAVVVTVLMRTGRAAELSTVRDILANYNRCRGPQRFPVVVSGGRLDYVFAGVQVSVDPALDEAVVLDAIRAALGSSGLPASTDASRGLFATGRRQFGDREYATRVEGTIQAVDGVLWSRVVSLGHLGVADDPATLVLPAAPRPLASVVDCADDRILALHAPHLELSVVAAPPKECAS